MKLGILHIFILHALPLLGIAFHGIATLMIRCTAPEQRSKYSPEKANEEEDQKRPEKNTEEQRAYPLFMGL